jgi:hypothetical protein
MNAEMEDIDAKVGFEGRSLKLELEPGGGLEEYLTRVKKTEERASRWANKKVRKEYAIKNNHLFMEFELIYTARLKMDIKFLCKYNVQVKSRDQLEGNLSALRVMGFYENPELLQ